MSAPSSRQRDGASSLPRAAPNASMDLRQTSFDVTSSNGRNGDSAARRRVLLSGSLSRLLAAFRRFRAPSPHLIFVHFRERPPTRTCTGCCSWRARDSACSRTGWGGRAIAHAHPNRLPELRPRRCHRRVAAARAHLLAMRTRSAHQERQAGEVPHHAGRGCRARRRYEAAGSLQSRLFPASLTVRNCAVATVMADKGRTRYITEN
jgi:hypothetical protein